MPQSFGTWLMQQTNRRDPVGDVARDFASDVKRIARRPSSFRTPRSLVARMTNMNACYKALRAARRACEEWRKQATS